MAAPSQHPQATDADADADADPRPSDDETHAALTRAFELASAYVREDAGRPPWAEKDYDQLLSELSEPLPPQGLPGDQVIAALARHAAAGLNCTTGGRFFGWVIGGSHPVGVAADWLTSAWGQNAGNVVAAPAASAFEEIVRQWLLALFGLPAGSGVGLTTGATMANMTALAAARSELLRRSGYDLARQGMFGAPEIRVLLGEEAHATIDSGLSLLGFGSERVVRLPADDQGRMKGAALVAALQSSPAPTLVIAQAGHVNTGAFDPFEQIVPAVRQHPNAWLHVDGAFGLWALCTPSLAHLAPGVQEADSWATDGHKWLQVPYDCGFVIVRDAKAHRLPLQVTASYLPDANDRRDPSHYVPELSRRARGFCTWAIFKALGRSGIVAMVEGHVALARHLAETIRGKPGLQVVNDVVLNQVLVACDTDDATVALEAKLRQENRYLLAGGRFNGRQVLRVSIIGLATTREHVDGLADDLIRVAGEIAGAP